MRRTASAEPGSKGEGADRPGRMAAAATRAPLGRLMIWAALVALLGLFGGLASYWGTRTNRQVVPSWPDGGRSWLAGILTRLAAGAAIEASASLLLGFLWTLAIGWRRPSVRFFRTRTSLAALATVALLVGLRLGTAPALPDLVIPAIAAVGGVAVGAAFLGRVSLGRLCLQGGVCGLVGLLAALALATAATGRHPAPFPVTVVTSSDKHRLLELLKRSKPGQGPDRQSLELTDHDVNLLAAWWLRADRDDRKLRIRFDKGQRVHVDATGRLSGAARYLNLRAAGRLDVRAGRLHFDFETCSIGHLHIPRPLFGWLARTLRTIVEQDPHLDAMLGCIASLQIDPGRVRVVGNADQFRRRVLPALLAKASLAPEVTAATRAHIRHLVLAAGTMPRRGDDRFLWIVRSAFAFARERSHWSRPVDENRAALLAVAILAGDRRLETLIGPVIDRELRPAVARRMRNFRIYGRVDWEKHLVVSAALSLLLDASLDQAIGLMKERLDSADGGSGFSFSDLMADRAGSRLARRAVRDDATARALQKAIAQGLTAGDLFPSAYDLPEGISEAELVRRYGGVGGAAYRRLEAEIEKRLDQCRLLGGERGEMRGVRGEVRVQR